MTSSIGLVDLEPAEVSPHLAVNAAFRRIDAVANLSVLSFIDAVEGVSPEIVAADGARYIITSTGEIAHLVDGTWEYIAPLAGWKAYVVDEGLFYRFTASTSPAAWLPWNSGITLAAGEWGGSSTYQNQELHDDLIVGAPHWNTSGSVTWTGEVGAPGVMVLTSTTSTTSAVAATLDSDPLTTDAEGRFIVGGGEIEFEARVRVSQVSTVSDRYILRVGLIDELSGAPGNGIYFGTAGDTGVWQYSVRNGTATLNDDVLTPTANQWATVRLVINAAGTSVDFYVDGVLKDTITTNIPSAALRVGMSIVKSAGSAVIVASMDYFRVRQTFSAERFP